MILKTIFLNVLFIFALWGMPEVAAAQTGFVPCVGIECNTCHLVEMGNTILVWLIGMLFVVFGVLVAVAGWGLVTSAGNQSALADAKSKFTNAFIGLFIVLAAWLLVDTIMRSLLTTVGPTGPVQQGTIAGFGPWSQVECVTPPTTEWVETAITVDTLVTSAAMSCDIGPSGERVLCDRLMDACAGTATRDTSTPGNYTVTCDTLAGVQDPSTTSEACDAGPSGDRVLCSRLETECRTTGGTPYVDTQNPREYRVSCAAASPTGACQTTEMSSVNLFGRRTTVASSIAGRLESVDSQWRSNGGDSYYRVYSVGAYSCRRVTGGPGYSVHAYGLAVDINPRDNPYHEKSGACRTNMTSSGFQNLFKSSGFGWGGDWRSVCDAMHFSAARHEGGWINLR